MNIIDHTMILYENINDSFTLRRPHNNKSVSNRESVTSCVCRGVCHIYRAQQRQTDDKQHEIV